MSSNGISITLPVHAMGRFVQGMLTSTVASSTVIVAGTTLVNPNGRSRYQSLANNGFYGAILHLSDETNAIANFDTLAAQGLENDEIEIVIVDTSP